MKHIQNLLRFAIIAIITVIISGSPSQTQAAQNDIFQDNEKWIIQADHKTVDVGEELTIRISVSNLSNFGEIIVNITYDPEVIQATACERATVDINFICNEAYSHDIIRLITSVKKSDISKNVGLAELTFQTIGSYGDRSILNISALKLTDNRNAEMEADLVNGSVSIFSCANIIGISQTECEALMALYNSTDGPNWTVQTDWLVTTKPCRWHGVTCTSGRVTALRLRNGIESNNLSGDLSAAIGNLTALTKLDLSNNQLSSVPTEIGNLTNLTELFVSSNQLISLPPEIGNLTNLTDLSSTSNQMSHLPMEIGNLTKLTHLCLSSNQLSSLPPEIGNLTELTQLCLSDNQLSSLPAEIGNLTNLAGLFLTNNHLSSLPAEIGNLTNLTRLTLDNNHLSRLPQSIGDLTNLTMLVLSSNQLSSLSTEIGNFTNLADFDLAYNQLALSDSDFRSFVTEHDSDWAVTQTVAPIAVKATVLGHKSIELTWTPILFQDKGGYYEISVSDGSSFTVHGTTINKSASSYLIDGLAGGTNYKIRIRTYTPIHNADPSLSWDDQPNELWSEYSTVISATTQVPPTLPETAEDSYESNNDCLSARRINVDGIVQHHTFHQINDQDWSTFTVATAGIYRIEATIPDNSRADVDLYYYTDCNSLAREKFIEVFSPGARLDVKAESAGQSFYIKVNNFDRQAFGSDVAYHLSVRKMSSEPATQGEPLAPGPAIVVAGSYSSADSAQDNINQIAVDFYKLLQGKGRKDSDIYFLATNSSLLGYDETITERNLELAITSWAKTRLEEDNVSKVLTLYLVDHGDRDKLYLDRVNQQILIPDDLDAWLTTLEEAIPGLWVNVFIEACHAGSFITRRGGSISKAGRVIITSSDEDYDAFVSRHGAAFSDDFITFLQQEYNLGYSYQQSVNRLQDVHSNQEPWIDADGNGIPNEPNDISIASLRSFAGPGSLGDDWPPYIAAASRTGQQPRIQAEVRHQGGNLDIEEVWAVVYPPDYIAPTGEAAYEDDGVLNELALDVIEFRADDEAKYVQTEPYTGFTQAGVYRVVVHARDVKGLAARSVTVEVDTRHLVYLPVISR